MPRLSNEVAIHLEKARESAFLAVETYNRPRTSFRSGGYIVLMCIAWTALFHAIFFRRKIKPFYRQKNHRGRFEIIDGDMKAWELSTSLTEYWKTVQSPIRTNLEFFIKLRNKIEHRSMPGLDMRIFGECQALLFNFEDMISEHFGTKWALNESLSLALQFSSHRHEGQQRSVRKLHSKLAKDISAYIDAFRSSLSVEQLQDAQFSYKVFLFPKPANHASSADMAVEFVKYDPTDPDAMARISKAIALIKPVTAAPIAPQLNGEVTVLAHGLPVRLTTEATATPVRAFSPDDVYPYRQMDILRRLQTLLPEDTRVTTHDLLCVRSVYGVAKNPDYFYKGKFGGSQYSEAYALWIAESFAANPEFFEDARARYREGRVSV